MQKNTIIPCNITLHRDICRVIPCLYWYDRHGISRLGSVSQPARIPIVFPTPIAVVVIFNSPHRRDSTQS